jgi:hypothetical protein
MNANLVLDANGRATLQSVSGGKHLIYVDENEPSILPARFIQFYDNQSVLAFTHVAAQSQYDVTLPRVVYSEVFGPQNNIYETRASSDCKTQHSFSSDPNGAPFVPCVPDHYLAQSFTLASAAQVCELALGVGVGSGQPDTLQIRPDAGGVPDSTILAEAATVGVAEADNTHEGVYAKICKNPGDAPLDLAAGTYWMIAKFNTIPNALGFSGGLHLPSNGVSVKSSSDGANWINAVLGGENESIADSTRHRFDIFLVR